MWLVWWLRWHGLRLIFGNTEPQGRGWGQPARVRVTAVAKPSSIHNRPGDRNRWDVEIRLRRQEDHH